MFSAMQSINSPPPPSPGEKLVERDEMEVLTGGSEGVSDDLKATTKVVSMQSARVTSARNVLLTANDELRHRISQQQLQIEEALAIRHLIRKIRDFKNWSAMNMSAYCNVDNDISALSELSLGAMERETQDFKAITEEIRANEAPFASIKDSAKQYSNPRLIEELDDAITVWESLLAATESKSKSLQVRLLRVEHDQQLQWCSTHIRALATSEEASNLGSSVDECVTLKERNAALLTELVVVGTKIDLVLEVTEALQDDKDGYKENAIKQMHELKVTLSELLDRTNSRTVELEQARIVLEAVGQCKHFHASASKKKDQLSSSELGGNPREAKLLLELHATQASDLVAFVARVRDHLELCATLPSPDDTQTSTQKELNAELTQMLEKLEALEKHRFAKLTHSQAVQVFLSDVQRISQWMQRVEEAINAEDKTAATTTSAARALQDGLAARMAEFDAKKAEVDSKIVSQAQDLLGDEQHDSSISTAVDTLLVKISGIEALAQAKAVELSQWSEQLEFSARVASVEHWVTTLCNTVRTAKHGDDIDDVSRQQRAHESLEKRVQGQQAMMTELAVELKRLEHAVHPAYTELCPLLEDVQRKRGELETELSTRKTLLDARLEVFQFGRDTTELRAWINKKQLVAQNHLPDDVTVTDETSAHETFMEELKISTSVASAKEKAATLSYTLACIEEDSIQAVVTLVEEEWEKLLHEGEVKAKYLADRSLLETFEHEASQLEHLLAALAESAKCVDVGTNLVEFGVAYENFIHSLFEKIGAIKMRICKFYTLATKVEAELKELPECAGASERVEALKLLESSLNVAIENRRQMLERANLCHTFVADAQEVTLRIEGRTAALEVLDLGDDLAAAELLQREQTTFERELNGLKAQVVSLGGRHAALEDVQGCNPDEAAKTIQLAWANMGEKLQARRTLIDDSLALQTFLHKCQIAIESIHDMSVTMGAESVANLEDTDAAKALQQRHSERRKEIDAWGEKVSALLASGNALCERKHYAEDKIMAKMSELELSLSNINMNWETLEADLHGHCEGLEFGRSADDIETLLNKQKEDICDDDFDNCEIEDLAKLLQDHNDHMVHLAAIGKRHGELLAKTDTFVDETNTTNGDDTDAVNDADAGDEKTLAELDDASHQLAR
eukprot:m.154261 g.154261  ORF g.154261 m.154261 type:complete len:1145 (-) comp30880_c0_seq1:197-3631(-)